MFVQTHTHALSPRSKAQEQRLHVAPRSCIDSGISSSQRHWRDLALPAVMAAYGSRRCACLAHSSALLFLVHKLPPQLQQQATEPPDSGPSHPVSARICPRLHLAIWGALQGTLRPLRGTRQQRLRA